MKNPILRLTFIVLLCLKAGLSFSQTTEWLWAKGAGGPNDEMGVFVATDASGNAFVAGYFKSPSLTLGSITLTRTGNCNVFLAKYDAGGNVIWAISPPGTDYDMPYAVATDASGNVVVAGLFSSPVITFGSISLTNAGIEDAFVAKYDAAGNVMWAKRAGGADWDHAHGLAVDGTGNVFLAGSYRSPSIIFGSITLTNTAAGIYDAFLVKYDSGGNVLWAAAAGGPGNNLPMSLSTDQWGNVFMTGAYTGPLMTFGSMTVTNKGLDDLFIAKYDESGNVLWAKSEGGSREDNCYSVATDGAGNAYITGLFRSETITFGTIDLWNSAGWYPTTDIFLTKYDGSGNVLWASGAGGLQNDQANSVVTDADGNVFFTGFFYSDSATFGSTILVNANDHSDMFLAKFDPAGSNLWALRAGGTDDDNGSSVAVDPTGNIFMTGTFASPVITFGFDTLNNSGGGDLFLARLDDNVTGIGEFPKSEGLSLFPSPATNQITITSLTGAVAGTVTVFNLEGVRYLHQDITDITSRLEISALPPGLYFVRLVSKQGVQLGKFMKK